MEWLAEMFGLDLPTLSGWCPRVSVFDIDLCILGRFNPIVLLAVIAITYTFLRCSWKHNYWRRKNVPYVKPYPILGSLWETIKKPLHQIELDRYLQLGPIYGHYECYTPLISVGDPDLLKGILKKDFKFFVNKRRIISGGDIVDKMLGVLRGEDWKRVRKIISPTFSSNKMKSMMSIFKDCSQTLVNNFSVFAAEEKSVDLKKFYGAFTMDVITNTAFSRKIDSHNDPENDFVKNVKKVFSENQSLKFIGFFLMPRVMKWLGLTIVPADSSLFFKTATLGIIEDRKRTGERRNDFLQLMIDSSNESLEQDTEEIKDIASGYSEMADDPAEAEGATGDTQTNEQATTRYLSPEEIISQGVAFFFAGYETTATSLSLATYLLSQNQDVQDRLRADVEEKLAKTGGELTYDILADMKYLSNVISEALRLYPPCFKLERMAEADYKLGDTGIVIPKDMIVTVPVYAIHRDPKYFPDPEVFNPDRFDEQKDIYSYYFPFGCGQRSCVAMRFAIMEMKICLAYMIVNYTILPCPDTQEPCKLLKGHQGLLQAGEVIVKLKKRENPSVK